MLNSEEGEKLRNQVWILRAIWFLFIDSFVLYMVLLFLITRFGSGEPIQDDGVFGSLFALLSGVEVGALKHLFIIVSFILVLIRFLVLGRLWLKEDSYKDCQTFDKIIGRYNQYFFVTLAFSEVPALFGFVLVLSTGRMEDWWPFFIIAMVLGAASFPRADKVKSILQAHAVHVQ